MLNTPFKAKKPTGTELASQFVQAWASRARVKGAAKGVFVLDGAKVSDHEVGSPQGLLPLFAWHADNLYRYGMGGAGMGMRFEEDAESLLHRRVNMERLSRSTSEVLCFIVEAVEDARQHLPHCASVPGAVELRGLVNQFAADMGVVSEPAQAVLGSGAKLQA